MVKRLLEIAIINQRIADLELESYNSKEKTQRMADKENIVSL